MSHVLHRPVYTLRIELADIEPAIYRVIEVAASCTLRELHDAIQACMGWEDSHMHIFEIGTGRYGIGNNEYDDDEQAEAGVLLGDLGLEAGDRFSYVYDYGDEWLHNITVERIRRDVPEHDVPRLIAGARACPPEDCGGVQGYYNVVEVLADRRHEDHAAMKEWLRRSWRPDRFDLRASDLAMRAKPVVRASREFDLPPALAWRALEVMVLMEMLLMHVHVPDHVVDLCENLIEHFAMDEPAEFLAVRKPELWLAAGVHAAFMISHHSVRHRLTLHELADICEVSPASVGKRSGQLRSYAERSDTG